MRAMSLARPFAILVALAAAGAAPSTAPDAAIQVGADGIACIQNALGGVRAFAGVSSLHIRATTKPASTARAANRREIGMVFPPDRYKRHDAGTGRHEGLSVVVGFDGKVLLSFPRPPNDAAGAAMLSARRELIGQVLRRHPRQLPGVRMSQRILRDPTGERLAIDAHGAGSTATLLADSRTCVPIAVEYAVGSDAYRIDVSEFRRFGGILFPTVLRTRKNGEFWTDEYVSDVKVNTAIDAFFRE